jgi:hypothetical protein
MTGDDGLDDLPRARWTDPETSHAALDSVTVEQHEARKQAIVEAVRAAGRRGLGLTEISDALDVPRENLSSTVTKLRRTGLLVDSGRRRPTPTGRDQIVYVTPEHEVAVDGLPDDVLPGDVGLNRLADEGRLDVLDGPIEDDPDPSD